MKLPKLAVARLMDIRILECASSQRRNVQTDDATLHVYETRSTFSNMHHRVQCFCALPIGNYYIIVYGKKSQCPKLFLKVLLPAEICRAIRTADFSNSRSTLPSGDTFTRKFQRVSAKRYTQALPRFTSEMRESATPAAVAHF